MDLEELSNKIQQEMIKYPEERAKQLEREVNFERMRRREVERELKDLKKYLSENNRIGNDVKAINQEVVQTSEKIKGQILPLINKNSTLKQACYNLYVKLGYTSDMAQYEVLCLTEDWNQLDGPIRSMMNSKQPTSPGPGAQQETEPQMGGKANEGRMNV